MILIFPRMDSVLIHFALLFSLFVLVRSDTYCNSCSFPRVLGGDLDNTIIKAIDYDADENIFIGGISYDTSLVGSITDNFKPFIGYFTACEFQWMHTFNTLQDFDITKVDMNDDGSLAVFSTDVKDDQIWRSIVRTSDGSTVATYQKCHSSTYVSGRSAALSLSLFGSETDYLMYTAEPSSTSIVFCKYTPSGI